MSDEYIKELNELLEDLLEIEKNIFQKEMESEK